MSAASAMPLAAIENPGQDLARKTVCINIQRSRLGNSRKVSAAQVEVDTDKTLLRISKRLFDCPEYKAIANFDADKLAKTQGEVTPRLTAEAAKASDAEKIRLDEKTFRWMHNQDAMAVEKLSEGIRKFYADTCKLEQYAVSRVTQKAAG